MTPPTCGLGIAGKMPALRHKVLPGNRKVEIRRHLTLLYVETTMNQLGKAVSFVGGFVGGTINVIGCRSIGQLDCRAFPAMEAA